MSADAIAQIEKVRALFAADGDDLGPRVRSAEFPRGIESIELEENEGQRTLREMPTFRALGNQANPSSAQGGDPPGAGDRRPGGTRNHRDWRNGV